MLTLLRLGALGMWPREGPTVSSRRCNLRVTFAIALRWVIGGAQGIGRAIAMRLAREGAQAVIGDIDRTMMVKAAREAQAAGCELTPMFCDVRVRRHVDQLIVRVIRFRP